MRQHLVKQKHHSKLDSRKYDKANLDFGPTSNGAAEPKNSY